MTAIGNEETLPVRLLEWEDDEQLHVFTGVQRAKANQSREKPSVGRGIYAENSVVALIVLSIFLSSVFSLLMVSQYRRPEKTGTGGFPPSGRYRLPGVLVGMPPVPAVLLRELAGILYCRWRRTFASPS